MRQAEQGKKEVMYMDFVTQFFGFTLPEVVWFDFCFRWVSM